MQAGSEDLLDKFWAIELNIDRSCRYHNRRRAFYDSVSDCIKIINILSGSTSFISLFGGMTGVAIFGSGIVALASAMDQALKPSERARLHAELYRRFSMLNGEFHSTPVKDEASLREIQTALYKIEADEPPIYRALDVSCHNEVVQARNIGERVQLTRTQFWLMHIVRFSGHRFVNVVEKP